MIHYRQPEGAIICLVRELEKWISSTRDTYRLTVTDFMWHVPGVSPLTSDTVAALMKATCTLVGLPPDKISAHSLRYGRATTLIALYGSWAEGSKAMNGTSARATSFLVLCLIKWLPQSVRYSFKR